MRKRRSERFTPGADGTSIPLAIQLFLWRQTEPFLRQKLGKLYENSCVSLEHVLVENKFIGLPPSLYEAITKTPRRKLIEAALPHVMHCVSVMLSNRSKLGQNDKLGVASTKLLHTFHSILLESMDTVIASDDLSRLRTGDVSNIELFVFLFAPLAYSITASDLTFRLASGLKIWKALWTHEIPDVAAMNFTVKPTESTLEGVSIDESHELDDDNDDDATTTASCQTTAFDIAVLRCLFFSRWTEEGVLWGANYLLKRTFWRRSKSMCAPRSNSNDGKPRSKRVSAYERIEETAMLQSLEPKKSAGGYNEQSKKPRGFLNRLRFSERSRKSKTSVVKPSWVIAFRESSANSDPEDKNSMKQWRDTPTRKMSIQIKNTRKKFQRISMISSISADEPPGYETIVGPTLVKQSSFDEQSGRYLQKMEHLCEESLPSEEKGRCEITAQTTGIDPFQRSQCDEKPGCSRDIQGVCHVTEKFESLPINRRWASDTCVSYDEEQPVVDSEITSKYVTADGFFRCDVLLRAIDAIISRNPGLAVYDSSLQITECIMRSVFLKNTTDFKARCTAKLRSKSKVKLSQRRRKPGEDDVIQVIDVILKFIRPLRCERQCPSFGPRGSAGERLRFQARLLLEKMFMNYNEFFCKHLSTVLDTSSLKESVELLHLLFITCKIEFDSTNITGLDEEFEWVNEEEDNDSSFQMTRKIAECTFEPFIKKCLSAREELYSSSCKTLYRNAREIVQYVQQRHASIFNKLMLDVLLKPTRKWKLWKKEREKQDLKEKSNDDSQFLQTTQKTTSKRRGAVVLAHSPLLPRANPGGMKSSKLRFNTIRSDLNGDDFPVARETGRTGSVFGKIQLTNWLKSKQDSSSSLDLEDMSDGQHHQNSDKTKQGEQRSLMNIIKGGAGRKHTAELQINRISDPCEIMCDVPHREEQNVPKYFCVDGSDIYNGLQVLRFLMECCPPGTVPQPNMVAAVIDLESPVVCRAAFLLEIAAFVNRCANSDWPRWMSNTDPGIPKLFVRATRQRKYKTFRLRAWAGRLFHMWGEALGKRLNQLCVMENGTTIVLPNVRSDSEKIRLRDTDVKEDFLCDSSVNRSGSSCPTALKMMASHLLFEITSFVRDAAPQCVKAAKKILSEQDENESTVTATPTATAEVDDSTARKLSQTSRRKSISFLTDFDKKLRKNSGAEEKREVKTGRKSAPESALRGDFKGAISRTPKARKTSSVSDNPSENRCRNASTGFALEELQENSALVSVHPVRAISEVAEDTKHGRKSTQRNLSTNYLKVPSVHTCVVQSPSKGCLSAGGSCHSLQDDCGEEFVRLADRADICASSVSMASSHTEGIRAQSSSSMDFKLDDEWLLTTPWLQVMLGVCNQQNFVCEHKSFCHTYCHQRLVRSCRRLIQALCKALDNVDDNGRQIKNTSSLLCQQANLVCNAFVTRYLKTNASSLMSSPIMTLTKSVIELSDERVFDVESFCWEMILDENKDISTAAATLFLLCAVKSPRQVFSTITSELTHTDPNLRLDAVLKFKVLWNCKHSVWEKVQDRMAKLIKSSSPGVNYPLPKSTLETTFLTVPNAPWVPVTCTIEESIIASDSISEDSALLTMDTTARHKEKRMKEAVRKAEEKSAKERLSFRLADVPVIQYAIKEIENKSVVAQEDDEFESHAASRRYSVAPSIASSNYSNKDARLSEGARLSFRQVGRSFKREPEELKGDEQIANRESLSKSTPVFPPGIAACIPTIIENCKDTQLTKENFSVGEISQQILESCLIENPSLFLRHVFERLSDKDQKKQGEAARTLRKLPSILGRLPRRVAYIIFTNLLGILVKSARSQMPACDRSMITCMGILASIVPFVEGLEFKTLKMVLRKEQSEIGLLTSSGLPGPKIVTVWIGNQYYMPALVKIKDGYTFENVIEEVLQQGADSVSDSESYELVDKRLNVINCRHLYVDDVYVKKAAPEVTLTIMKKEKAEKLIKERVILIQIEEIQKLRFTLSILISNKNLEDRRVNASFILDEFLRLSSFPRKAIDAPFEQFQGKLGRQIADFDMMQKTRWIQLISTIFQFLPSEFPWGSELMLFLNVWNAALVIHALQKPMLRWYGAAVIDAAVHMNHHFVKTGYSIILPTLLKVYSEHYGIPSVKDFVEFLCKQLHIIHRHPFILELIAAAVPILTASMSSKNSKHLTAEEFFTLLQSLEQENSVDRLQVLELIKAEQPLHSFDICYKNESASVSIMDCLRLCVTVVACQPESARTLEMLVVLEQILPCYLQNIQEGSSEIKTLELLRLREVSACIRSLLISLECLTRNLSHNPQQHQTTHKVYYRDSSACSGQRRHLATGSGEDRVRIMEEGLIEDSQDKLRRNTEDFLAPRDVVLRLCSKYYIHVHDKLQQLDLNSSQQIEILSDKSHTRLAEIAQSLMKLLTEDSFSMRCPGLMMYLTEMIPKVEWSDENNRSTLFLILKSRQKVNWTDLRRILLGISKLITNQSVVSVIPHIKSIVTANLAMLIGSVALLEADWSPKNTVITDATVPKSYEPAILQITMAYMSSMRATVTLEDLVRHFSQGKRDFVILNFFIPLCINAAYSLSRRAPKENASRTTHSRGICPIRECDVMYMFDYAFEVLAKDSASLSNNISQLLLFTSPVSHRRTNLSHQASLLLLKVLITCFHDHLQRHWFNIATSIQKVVFQRASNPETWLLMDFIMSIKTPLVLYLRPFVLSQMPRIKTDGQQVRSLLERMTAKVLNIQLKKINLQDLTRDFERDVAHLKAEIAANAPGSKPKTLEKNSRERRSIRHAVLQQNFGRKASSDINAAGRNSTSHQNNHVMSSPNNIDGSVTESISEVEMSDETDSKQNLEPRENIGRLRILRRRWTHKATRPAVKGQKSKRHSVSTTQNTSSREDTPNSPNERKSSSPSRRPSFKNLLRANFNMGSRCESKRSITGSDELFANDDISLIDDVFSEENESRPHQRRKSSFLAVSQGDDENPNTSTNQSGQASTERLEEPESSGIQESNPIIAGNICVCVTSPTPPGQRR